MIDHGPSVFEFMALQYFADVYYVIYVDIYHSCVVFFYMLTIL